MIPRRPAPVCVLLLSLSAFAAGFGCGTGADTFTGGSYPEADGAAGSGGGSDAAPDATGGSGATGGKDGGGGAGGQPPDASPDTSPDVSEDAAADSAEDAPPDTLPEGGGGLGVGEPCTDASECASGFCEEVGLPGAPQKACIRPCLANADCPDGSRCTTVPPLGHVCAPYHDEACAACTGDVDCAILGNQCLTGTGGQQYCGVDCSFDDVCPAGLECQTVSGKKLCVQTAGETCPCAPNRDGETRPCENVVNGVVCHGVETCDGNQAAFSGCTALTPTSETCNGIDDDCNGTPDDLPHATCDCSGGSCSLVCSPGFAHYPESLPETDGCPCTADAFDGADGGSCGSPHTVTAVADTSSATTVVSGTLSSDTDEDWFVVTFNDVDETVTNSFHASIAFTSNPNDEFEFVVVPDCASAPSAPRYKQVDNCVNISEANNVGLAVCGPTAVNHCQSMTMTRTIGVLRNPAAASKTCASYELTIAGGGACLASTSTTCTW